MHLSHLPLLLVCGLFSISGAATGANGIVPTDASATRHEAGASRATPVPGMENSGSLGIAGSDTGVSGISGSGIGTITIGPPSMGTTASGAAGKVSISPGSSRSGISGSRIGIIDLGTGGSTAVDGAPSGAGRPGTRPTGSGR